jgi:hypothetical protein
MSVSPARRYEMKRFTFGLILGSLLSGGAVYGSMNWTFEDSASESFTAEAFDYRTGEYVDVDCDIEAEVEVTIYGENNADFDIDLSGDCN